jgi:hypothetical protein
MTLSEKRQNLKDLNVLYVHINDLDHEIETQYPQPDGNIYLQGLKITTRRYNEAVSEYNICLRKRILDGGKWPHEEKKTVTFINRRKREHKKPVPVVVPFVKVSAVLFKNIKMSSALNDYITEHLDESFWYPVSNIVEDIAILKDSEEYQLSKEYAAIKTQLDAEGISIIYC